MRSLRSFFPSLCFFLALLSVNANAQAPNVNVTTWHNDNNRTGWQAYENILSASTGTGGTKITQSNFGLIWQYNNSGNGLGHIYAQPLVVGNLPAFSGCPSPCSLVFVATEEDKVYAFNAASNSQTPVWSADLAMHVTGGANFVYCPSLIVDFPPCDTPQVLGTDIGVTGTPVIDTDSNLLYVAAIVQLQDGSLRYYLFAIDITSGTVETSKEITGSVTGLIPTNPDSIGKCTTTYPGTGTVNFDFRHIQRSALLLLNHKIYIAFSPSDGEWENGWIFGYTYSASPSPALTQIVPVFNTTPYGTGGGIWQAGAGLAAEVRQDGTTYMYGSTGNGTFDVQGIVPIANDIGDSMMKMSVNNTSGVFSVVDYYTPFDVLTLPGNNGVGRCINDVDFASGGTLLFPDTFYIDQSHNNSTPRMMVNADKESRLYVLNRDSLGHFNPADGNFIERVDIRFPFQNEQGFWSSPAYWKYLDGNNSPHYMLYYSVTTEDGGVAPYPLDGYKLLTTGTTGPIDKNNVTSTQALFCPWSPTPSVSSNGTTAGTGIMWAIEHWNAANTPINPHCNDQNDPNNNRAYLHAFDATDVSRTELYSNRTANTSIGNTTSFSTPTIFQGRVYVGTNRGVGVFGLCATAPGGQCQP